MVKKMIVFFGCIGGLVVVISSIYQYGYKRGTDKATDKIIDMADHQPIYHKTRSGNTVVAMRTYENGLKAPVGFR